MKLYQKTVEELCLLTASKIPTPGGGAISAMNGAFAAALTSMVANLTLGKKKYACVQMEMNRIIQEAETIRIELLEAMDLDTSAFNGVMIAIGMPKETDEERTSRQITLQSALKKAAEIPLHVAVISERVLVLAESAVRLGNKSALSDGLCAAMMARSAVLGALYNTKINLLSIEDTKYSDEVMTQVRTIEARVIEHEATILALTPKLN